MSLIEILIVTGGLAALCTVIVRLSIGTMISAGTAYWAAWLVLLLSGIYCQANDLLSYPVSGITSDLILKLHIGATIGILVASILVGRVRVRRWIAPDQSLQAERFLQKHFTLIVWVVGAVATAHLMENVGKIGIGTLYGNLIYDLRVAGLTRELSLIGLISSYLQGIIMPVAILMARADRVFGFRVRRMAALIVVAGIHGFALGGRGFLASPLIAYGTALLVCRARGGSLLPARWRNLWGLGAACLIAFVVLGAWRAEIGGSDKYTFGENIFRLPLGWIGDSVAPIEPASQVYSGVRMDGRLVFDGISGVLEKLGLVSGQTKVVIAQERDAIAFQYGFSVSVLPPTIIPFLIGDVGEANMMLYMAAIIAALHFLSIGISPSSLTAHTMIVIAVVACALTIQGNQIITSINLISLGLACVIDYGVIRGKRGTAQTGLRPVRSGGTPLEAHPYRG